MSISSDAIELMKELISVNAEKRLSAEEALNHSWLVSDCIISREDISLNNLTVKK